MKPRLFQKSSLVLHVWTRNSRVSAFCTTWVQLAIVLTIDNDLCIACSMPPVQNKLKKVVESPQYTQHCDHCGKDILIHRIAGWKRHRNTCAAPTPNRAVAHDTEVVGDAERSDAGDEGKLPGARLSLLKRAIEDDEQCKKQKKLARLSLLLGPREGNSVSDILLMIELKLLINKLDVQWPEYAHPTGPSSIGSKCFRHSRRPLRSPNSQASFPGALHRLCS